MVFAESMANTNVVLERKLQKRIKCNGESKGTSLSLISRI